MRSHLMICRTKRSKFIAINHTTIIEASVVRDELTSVSAVVMWLGCAFRMFVLVRSLLLSMSRVSTPRIIIITAFLNDMLFVLLCRWIATAIGRTKAKKFQNPMSGWNNPVKRCHQACSIILVLSLACWSLYRD